jgi:hypothetical protein
MRALYALAIVALLGCRTGSLDDARRRLDTGATIGALREYDAIAARSSASPDTRARALTGAAIALEKLSRFGEARARLERAVELDVPGASEPAMFYLAELERDRDRARALQLYYRAAAGAEKNLAGGFPWQAATNRLLELSKSR